jgi:hypothetical protein
MFLADSRRHLRPSICYNRGAMLAKRQPLLWAFAGGCLWGAGLIAFWGGGSASKQQGAPEQTAEAFVATPGSTREDDESEAHPPASQRESAPDDAHHVASVEPAAPKDPADGGGTRADPGSSVAEILMRLEGAYRQGLAVAPVIASASAPREAVPAPPVAQPVLAERAPAPAPALATAPPQPAPARAETAVALATLSAPPSNASPAAPPPATSGAAPAAGNAAPPSDIHMGDINLNAYVATVQQSNMVMAQQLAILQYLQLMALSPYGGQVASPAHAARALSAPRVVPYPTTLTNPDNPWGYNFPPPNLVH